LDLVETRTLVTNRHPWERARTSFFNRLARRAAGQTVPVRVLDVGCGDGWFSRQLIRKLPAGSEIVGWDIALDDGRLEVFSADLPSGMSLTNAEPSGEFDMILCMDVLEHVPDELRLLTELVNKYLRRGGHLVISVPAWLGLFSKRDLALRHYRRYSPRRARTLMKEGGLEVVRKGGLFHCLAAARVLQLMRWGRAKPLDDPATYPEEEGSVGLRAWNAPSTVTLVVAGALKAEGWVSSAASAARLELPGLSWWALCRKP
jgi:SAM-dependent methyltransferase